jgi:hypothetical protein
MGSNSVLPTSLLHNKPVELSSPHLIQKLVLNTLQHATNLSASSHFTLQGFSTTKVRYIFKSAQTKHWLM